MADLKESALFGSLSQQSSHWYYATKIHFLAKLLLRHCPVNISELRLSDWGAGNGIIGISIRNLLDPLRKSSLDLIDIGYNSSDFRNNSKNVRYLSSPEAEKSYNIFFAIDVVEHISDDLEFIRNLNQYMDDDALLFLAAPAFEALWSNHDVYLEHYRRYSLLNLERLCSDPNLKILDSGYLFTITLPAVLFIRTLNQIVPRRGVSSDMSVLPLPVNYILRMALRFESYLKLRFRWLRKMPGSTAYVVAQKR